MNWITRSSSLRGDFFLDFALRRAQCHFFVTFLFPKEKCRKTHLWTLRKFVCFWKSGRNLRKIFGIWLSRLCTRKSLSTISCVYFRFSNKYSLNLWLTVVLCLRFLVFMKYSGPQVSRKITFKVGANHSEFWLLLKVGANHSDKMCF